MTCNLEDLRLKRLSDVEIPISSNWRLVFDVNQFNRPVLIQVGWFLNLVKLGRLIKKLFEILYDQELNRSLFTLFIATSSLQRFLGQNYRRLHQDERVAILKGEDQVRLFGIPIKIPLAQRRLPREQRRRWIRESYLKIFRGRGHSAGWRWFLTAWSKVSPIKTFTSVFERHEFFTKTSIFKFQKSGDVETPIRGNGTVLCFLLPLRSDLTAVGPKNEKVSYTKPRLCLKVNLQEKNGKNLSASLYTTKLVGTRIASVVERHQATWRSYFKTRFSLSDSTQVMKSLYEIC